MSVLGDVFDSLQTMSQQQLLLAFIACIGYALAQGALIGPRGRRFAGVLAALGATGFALESAEWTLATMLLAVAVAGMGLFVAMVCLTSRALGCAPARTLPPDHESQAESASQSGAARALPARSSERAQSI